jgi:hypothetical protein
VSSRRERLANGKRSAPRYLGHPDVRLPIFEREVELPSSCAGRRGRPTFPPDRGGSRTTHGVRVTPHVFILPKELDMLVRAIGEIARGV